MLLNFKDLTRNVTTIKSKLQPSGIPCHNYYSCLLTEETENEDSCEERGEGKQKNTEIKRAKTKNQIDKCKKTQKTNLYTKMKITFCSDSQGRFVTSALTSLSNGAADVFGYLRPNTVLTQVVDSASLISDGSPVIIMGGSNDSLNGDFGDIYRNLEQKLTELSKTRPVFLCTIPVRYDVALASDTNQKLNLVNNYITELAVRINNVFLINLNSFRRSHFTSHGLHLNSKGKNKLAYSILESLSLWSDKNGSTLPNSNHANVKLQSIGTNTINIVEEDMNT